MMLVQVAVGVAAAMSMTVSMVVRVSSLMVSIDGRMVSMTHSLDNEGARQQRFLVVVSTVHLRVMSMANLLHDGFKTAVLVRLVLDDALGTVGLVQRVLSLDDIAITHFPLALVVAGVGILDTVLELVLRVRVVVLGLLVMMSVSAETVFSSVVLGGSNHSQTGNESDDLQQG
uniref:Uncharacterized protein n=1 Tax=Anopheles melas TaxID=34690 RepID=A0A182TI12_9DIPT